MDFEPPVDVDKSAYHLFNPTPRDLWRQFQPDRPTATESPRTLDAGAFAIEVGLFQYQSDAANSSPDRVKTLTAGFDTNLKLGLRDDMDVQVIFSPYAREETTTDAGVTTTVSGFSDITLRLKWNAWGNESGATALGLLPFLTIPTGTPVSTESVEGGLAVPFSWGFAEGWSLGTMPRLGAFYDDARNRYDVEFLHTLTLSFDIYGPLGGYAEYAGTLSSGPPYEATGNLGLLIRITPDLVLDGGVLLGLTSEANDVDAFIGLAVRF